jgi:trans-2-enoyl-CoA reductase
MLFPNFESYAAFVDPRRLRLTDREWGPQTKKKISRMVKAKVSLELRWLHDREKFERVYISEKGWEIEKIEVANEKSWRASAMQRMTWDVL